jgi:SAM-dependent methyltransferase
MGVPFDYDATPGRYRRGMDVARAHTAGGSVYGLVADWLAKLDVRLLLDVGCADGVLRAALPPSGPRLIGLDMSAALLRGHPPPAVRAEATRLPFADGVFDAVTALNVLYHLREPLVGVREAHRVLRAGGHLLVAVIARDDSPEFHDHWTRPRTTFDAEEAPAILGQVFGSVVVRSWDAPLLSLPSRGAIREYLLGRQVPAAIAQRAADELPVPLSVTKRGALILATRTGPG